MKKNRTVRALIKRPGEDFKTEYVDLTYEFFAEFFGVEPKDTLQMQLLACKNAVIVFTYESTVENCKVFDTTFVGPVMFIGQTQRGTFSDLTSSDDKIIRRYTRTPEDYKPKKKRAWYNWLWQV